MLYTKFGHIWLKTPGEDRVISYLALKKCDVFIYRIPYVFEKPINFVEL